MKTNSKPQYEYEEVEDYIIDMALYTVNAQKEDSLKEYKIAYEDDSENDNIKIIKNKDKYFINVNDIKGELKRDNKELPKLSEIDKINKKLLKQNNS